MVAGPSSSPISSLASPITAGAYDGIGSDACFPRVEEPVLAQFSLAPTGAFNESDDPRAGTGVIGSPRTEQPPLTQIQLTPAVELDELREGDEVAC